MSITTMLDPLHSLFFSLSNVIYCSGCGLNDIFFNVKYFLLVYEKEVKYSSYKFPMEMKEDNTVKKKQGPKNTRR